MSPKSQSPIEPGTQEQEVANLAEQKDIGLWREFFQFLVHNKKWWLAPIILVLLLFGVVIAISNSAAAPFIYSFW